MPFLYHNIECNYRFIGRRKVSAWLRDCVAAEGKTCGDVNVIFCSDEYLLGVNRQFLQHDYYTDVITFDYSTDGTISGDIYISVETVAQNASQYGATPRREMLRVILHGVLHLCGYGDKSSKEEKTMRAKEDHYLALLVEN